jgi:glycosyltransferase involved in cell wall biosynthesis
LHPRDVKKEDIILHVGRFRVKNVKNDDYKKQGIMIDAFKEMVTKGLKDWKFVLAVSIQDKDKEAFENMKKKTAGFPIEFLVNKNNDELWDIYSRSKIYWHASGFGEDLENNPEYAEHFGISTVEAMGAGVVPVVINAGGQKEIVVEGQNGFLWDSIEELQSKTRKLIEDESLLKNLSKQAVESSKKFSAERFYQEVNNLILK